MNPISRQMIGLLAYAGWVFSPAAFAQSTAFTYQGKLNDAGAAADGLHDFRFRLFDAATGGAQVGLTQCVDNVNVSEGLFTLQLDFGQQFITTGQRHLEIEVRHDTGLNCANTGGFIVLSPRQQITAAPLASHAKSAFALDATDGSPVNAVFVDNDGKVGIGSLFPGHRLDVSAGFLGDGIGLRGTAPNDPGYHLYDGATSRGTLGLALQSGNWSTSAAPGDIVLRSGTTGKLLLQNGFLAAALAINGNNVGIGTTAPAAKLHVSNGDLLAGAPGEEWIFHTRSSFGGDFLHITDRDAGIFQFQRGLTVDEAGNVGLLNANGRVWATGGEENLRIVRGTIDETGAVLAGAGFTVVRQGDARFVITLSTPFSGAPSVTATMINPFDDHFIKVPSVTNSSFTVVTYVIFLGQLNEFPVDFHFIAVGPR